MPLTSSRRRSPLPPPWWGVAAVALTLAVAPAARMRAEEAPASPRHHPHHAAHVPAGHHAQPPHRLPHHPPHHAGYHPGHPSPRSPVHPMAHPAQRPAPPAVPAPPINIGTNTGLPLPRFAALRADEVNMRSGPGTRYPILWLYKRRDLPVRIEREFDVWRLVEDSDGVKGWVHQATLTGTRSFVVTGSPDVPVQPAAPGGPKADNSIPRGSNLGAGALLRDDPSDEAGIVAILRPGVIGRLRACPAGSDWCRVTARSYGGWLRRSAIFGLLPNEAIARP